MFDFTLEPGKRLENKYKTENVKPYVSIITAFYNAGKYFEQTFNSVLNQTFPYFEWIIVNDGSDKKEDIELLKKFAAKDNRIFIYHKENGGAASARNLGIKKMSTEVAIILDADDLIEKNQLECLYWSLITNPKAAFAYTGLVAFGEEEYLWKKDFTSELEKKENILIINAAIRRDILQEVEGYSEIEKIYNEDWHLYLKILTKSYQPVQLNTYGFWYRIQKSGAFQLCMGNEERKRRNKEIIKEIAEHVPDGIRAITFSGKNIREFENIKKWDWKEKLIYNKKKTSILLLIPHMEMGGADKFNLDLVKNIEREKYSIGIITTNIDENKWLQNFSKYVDDIFELPKFLHENEWAAFIQYYIKSRGVELICNISSYFTYYLLPWLRLEFPQTAILDYIHADAQYWRNGGYTRLSAVFDEVIEKTIVANQATLDIMEKRYKKDITKCEISYIGTDEIYFNPNIVESGVSRKRHHIEIDRPIVLFLCRLSQEKRPLLMIEIAKEIKKRVPNICFMIVGEGECKEKIENKIIEYNLENTVILAGARGDVRNYYKDADIFLITSIKEGLTLTTFEAMAMKLPIISSNAGSQYEVVNSQTGALIPILQDEKKDFFNDNYKIEEVMNYVKAILPLLEDKEKNQKIGKYNRKLIEEKYSMRIGIKQIEKIWDSYLSVEKKAERKNIAENLKGHSKLIDELAMMYINYEGIRSIADEIWEGRSYYKGLYEKEIEKNKTQCENNSEIKLNEIYQMRSWKFIEHYQRFVKENKIGKFLRKILVRDK